MVYNEALTENPPSDRMVKSMMGAFPVSPFSVFSWFSLILIYAWTSWHGGRILFNVMSFGHQMPRVNPVWMKISGWYLHSYCTNTRHWLANQIPVWLMELHLSLTYNFLAVFTSNRISRFVLLPRIPVATPWCWFAMPPKFLLVWDVCAGYCNPVGCDFSSGPSFMFGLADVVPVVGSVCKIWIIIPKYPASIHAAQIPSALKMFSYVKSRGLASSGQASGCWRP